MATAQFVDQMATSPTVLLDLDASPLRISDGWSFSPASYEKGWFSSPLQHGARPTRDVAQNITLTIPIELTATTDSAAATAIENLGRQLSQPISILRVQLGSPNPVFYRCFGNPEYAMIASNNLLRDTRIELQVVAEPFAYGVRVDAGTFTVSNNPAAATNPCRFDITNVQGDVPTPLLLHATSTGASGAPSGLVSKWAHIATRRRGTPSNYSNLIQAEVMLSSTDTSVVADAAMSGGSKQRVTFATNTSMTVRLSDQFPENNTPTVEARGEYIVYARCAKTVASDNIAVQLRYGTGSVNHVTNTAVTLPTANTGPWLVNLGKVPVPSYSDPVTLGFSGVQLKALLSWVGLYAQRVSGSGSLDIDFLYFMPADESTLMVKFPVTDSTYAIDGTTDAGGSVYALNTALDQVLNIARPPEVVGGGGFPELIPGATTRIHILRNVDPTGTVDALTDTTTYDAYYWPRWREYSRT